MASNYLEQLVGEWLEFTGYFVRRNVLVGKRAAGGYECELDVVGYHPGKRHLIHVEPSMDANSWTERERRYTKKFAAGRAYIPELFEHMQLPEVIEQVALFVYGSNTTHHTIAGGVVWTMRDLMGRITLELSGRTLARAAVPEHLPLLRTIQFVSEYKDAVRAAWDGQRVPRSSDRTQ